MKHKIIDSQILKQLSSPSANESDFINSLIQLRTFITSTTPENQAVLIGKIIINKLCKARTDTSSLASSLHKEVVDESLYFIMVIKE